jgi:hypothetical protein
MHYQQQTILAILIGTAIACVIYFLAIRQSPTNVHHHHHHHHSDRISGFADTSAIPVGIESTTGTDGTTELEKQQQRTHIIFLYKLDDIDSQLIMPIWRQFADAYPFFQFSEQDATYYKELSIKYNIYEYPSIIIDSLLPEYKIFTGDNITRAAIYQYLTTNNLLPHAVSPTILTQSAAPTPQQQQSYNLLPQSVAPTLLPQSVAPTLLTQSAAPTQQQQQSYNLITQSVAPPQSNIESFTDKSTESSTAAVGGHGGAKSPPEACPIVTFDSYHNNNQSYFQIFSSATRGTPAKLHGYAIGSTDPNDLLTPYQAAYNVTDAFLSSLSADSAATCGRKYKKQLASFGICNPTELSNMTNELTKIQTGAVPLNPISNITDYDTKMHTINTIKTICS